MTRDEELRILSLRLLALFILCTVFFVCIFVTSGLGAKTFPFVGYLGTYALVRDAHDRYVKLRREDKGRE